MIGRLRTLLRDERGNSFIEMALVTPVFAALLVGMVDISRAVSAKVNVEQAAQRAIEKVQATDFETGDISTLEDDAEAAAGSGSSATADAWLECNHDGTHLDYDTGTCATGANYARYVRVRITGTYTPIFGTRLFPGANSNGTVNVGGQATVRTQ
jgi:Flp pilus assembly protein TadG